MQRTLMIAMAALAAASCGGSWDQKRSFPCFKPDQKIIEAMAHKDMVQIKKGEEIEVVEEVKK